MIHARAKRLLFSSSRILCKLTGNFPSLITTSAKVTGDCNHGRYRPSVLCSDGKLTPQKFVLLFVSVCTRRGLTVTYSVTGCGLVFQTEPWVILDVQCNERGMTENCQLLIDRNVDVVFLLQYICNFRRLLVSFSFLIHLFIMLEHRISLLLFMYITTHFYWQMFKGRFVWWHNR